MIKPAKIILFSIPFLLLTCYWLFNSIHAPLSDWAGYYFGSRELLNHNYQTVYDPASLNLLIAGKGFKGEFVSYTPFPPFTAIVISPFLVFSAPLSKIIFTAFSLFVFVIALYRSFRIFSIPSWFAVLIPFIFFFPIRNNIFLGQGYFLVTVLLIEGYIAYCNGKKRLSSFLWAIAILFKIFPALIILFLLFKKKYKEIIYILMICLILFSLSIFFVGLPAWKLYILDIFPRLNNGEFNNPFTAFFQSGFMLFKDLFIYDPLLNPSGMDHPYFFLALVILFKTFFIGACINATVRLNLSDLMTFGLWIIASILISPNGSNYSLILLTIPFLGIASAFPDIHQHKNKLIAALIILLLVANVSIHNFQQLPVLLKFPRLYLLIIFFLLTAAAIGNVFRFKTFIVVFAFFTVLSLFSLPGRTDKSQYLFSKEEHILIYDYVVKNNKLVYYYWDDKGSHEVISDFLVNEINYEGVSLRNNQLYFQDRKMTSSKDHKMKPALMNRRTIIYLSDQGRGVGFFSIRQISLF